MRLPKQLLGQSAGRLELDLSYIVAYLYDSEVFKLGSATDQIVTLFYALFCDALNWRSLVTLLEPH